MASVEGTEPEHGAVYITITCRTVETGDPPKASIVDDALNQLREIEHHETGGIYAVGG